MEDNFFFYESISLNRKRNSRELDNLHTALQNQLLSATVTSTNIFHPPAVVDLMFISA